MRGALPDSRKGRDAPLLDARSGHCGASGRRPHRLERPTHRTGSCGPQHQWAFVAATGATYARTAPPPVRCHRLLHGADLSTSEFTPPLPSSSSSDCRLSFGSVKARPHRRRVRCCAASAALRGCRTARVAARRPDLPISSASAHSVCRFALCPAEVRQRRRGGCILAIDARDGCSSRFSRAPAFAITVTELPHSPAASRSPLRNPAARGQRLGLACRQVARGCSPWLRHSPNAAVASSLEFSARMSPRASQLPPCLMPSAAVAARCRRLAAASHGPSATPAPARPSRSTHS